MNKYRIKDLNDLLGVIIRRRLLIISIFVLLFGLTVLLTLVFPKRYTSHTMILLQPREVPAEFVKDLIGGDTDARLKAIEQTILSRTNLLKIVEEFNAQLPEYRNLNDERRTEKLGRHITIELSSDANRVGPSSSASIRISYRNRNPELAQKITARIASLFIEYDNRTREDKVFGTAEFFESELKKVSDELRKSEDSLKALKLRYGYEMPSELETNLRTLDRLQIQKNGNLEALDRYVTLQMNLDRQISETPATIVSDSKREMAGKGARAMSELVDVYRKKEQEYKQLITKATPGHPDVRRLKAELEQMKEEIPESELSLDDELSGSSLKTSPNPVYQSLTAQLNQLKTDIGIREREKQWIEEEMAKYNRRIQNTPGVEQEMQTLIRNNTNLARQHEVLKTKLEEARLAGSLESREKGAQFEIIDPANFPLELSSPNRLIILFAGFCISIVVSLTGAVTVNSLSQRVWTHHELERSLQAPVLVEIPSIFTHEELLKARRKRAVHASVFIVLACIYLSSLYCVYVMRPSLLSKLDPIVQGIEERMND